MSGRRIVIGLVGQVCAGKSAVSDAFLRRGAAVYQADRIVHDLYGRDEVKADVRQEFGPEVFAADGSIDRRKLGKVVFADPDRLRVLTERIVFPRTGEVLKPRIDAFRSGRTAEKALVLDAPTLFEAGRSGWCDRLLFVSAPRECREAWAREQRGWSPEELTRREAHMMDEQDKRARCDEEIENSGSLEDLDRRVGECWRRWVEEGTA